MQNVKLLGLVLLATVPLAPIGAVAAAPASQSAAPAGTATGNVQHGHQLFLADGCYECHNTVGQGGVAGPRIAPNPPPAAAIEAYVRAPAGRMPPYSAKVLSSQDIRDIHAYLATIKKPDVTLPR